MLAEEKELYDDLSMAYVALEHNFQAIAEIRLALAKIQMEQRKSGIICASEARMAVKFFDQQNVSSH